MAAPPATEAEDVIEVDCDDTRAAAEDAADGATPPSNTRTSSNVNPARTPTTGASSARPQSQPTDDEADELSDPSTDPPFLYNCDSAVSTDIGVQAGAAAAPAWPALRWTRAALLAVEHVNNDDCSILADDNCEALLRFEAGAGPGAVKLLPRVAPLQVGSTGAAARAAQACLLGTDAQLLLAATAAADSRLVAAMAGSVDRLLLSPLAETARQGGAGNFDHYVRMPANTAVNIQAVRSFAGHLGWRQVALLHTDDFSATELREAVQDDSAGQVGAGPLLTLSSIGDASTSSITAALQPLLDRPHPCRVITILAFDADFLRILSAAKQIVTEHGDDLSTFTWIAGLTSTQDASLLAATDAGMGVSQLEGVLGVQVSAPKERTARLERALQEMDSSAEGFMRSVQGLLLPSGAGTPFTWDRDKLAQELQVAHLVPLDKYTAYVYDAVWSAAVGMAAAAAAAANATEPPTGKEFLRGIAEGGMPAFTGAAGRRAFLLNGDWDLNHTYVEITNYGTPKGASVPRHAAVARVDVTSMEVTMLPAERIVWASGREYPHVPLCDGTPQRSMATGTVAALGLSIIGIFLLAVAAVVVVRHRRLKKRGPGPDDAESPLPRMIDFLEKYQETRWWRRPKLAEAEELLESLGSCTLRQQGLTTPDMSSTLSAMSAPLRKFLQGQVGTLNADDQRIFGSPRRSRQSAEYARPSIDISRRMSVDFARPVRFSEDLDDDGPDESVPGPSRAATWGEGNGEGAWRVEDGGEWGVHIVPSKTTLVRNSTEERAAFERRNDELPRDVKDAIGTDFFLDVISPHSPLRRSKIPLVIVVAQIAGRLGFLKSAAVSRKLMKYTHFIEAGYPATGYHCKAHGADVTNRMMTIARTIGLCTQGSDRQHAKRAAPLALSCLLAAMVHDYGHPQVNNAFLVNQASQSSSPRPAENRKWISNMAIDIVLATDMSKHFDLIKQFNVQIARNKKYKWMTTQEKWTAMSDAQIRLTLQMAMKARPFSSCPAACPVADLGHCALPMDQHRQWTEALEEEFFSQGDKEREKGVKVSALMDRLLPGPSHPESQAGFFKFMVLPLYSAWVEAFPECKALLLQVHENLDYWNWAAAAPRQSSNEDAVFVGSNTSTESDRHVGVSRDSLISRSETRISTRNLHAVNGVQGNWLP
eukprot:jgi/Tetstr1/429229/TSEL_001892.t1